MVSPTHLMTKTGPSEAPCSGREGRAGLCSAVSTLGHQSAPADCTPPRVLINMTALGEGPVAEPISTACSVAVGSKVDTLGRVTDGGRGGWKMQNNSKRRVQRGPPGQLAGGRGDGARGGPGGGPTAAGSQRPGRALCWPRSQLATAEASAAGKTVSHAASGFPVSGISAAGCMGHTALPWPQTAYRWSWSRAHSEGGSPGAQGTGRRTSEGCRSRLLLPEAHRPRVKPAGKPLGDAWLLGTSCARPNALCWDWWGAEACTRCLRRPPNGPPRCLFSFATRRGHRACRLS